MGQSKKRVLVIDDEADIRMIVGLNLGLRGMEFGEAVDGAEGIEAISSGQWEACVLDLAMPHVDGFEVLKALAEKGLTNEIAVIVLSAKNAPAVAIEAMELGAHAHLIKPFSPAAVATLVEDLMGLTPEERESRRQQEIERAGSLNRLGMRTV
jgi:two-component system alkaline phosphatase synthesis response regulator PhoP